MNSLPTHPPLKLICLNIETDKHFDRILPFFKKENPDVVLLQEVLEKDMDLLEKSLEMRGIFTPITTAIFHTHPEVIGQATFTNLPLIESHEKYYRGSKDHLPLIELTPEASETHSRALNIVKVQKGKEIYCLANIHFTWAPSGGPSPKQAQDLETLLTLLSDFPDVILCGDFNSPRGTPIFDKIASKFKDNIPPDVTTTIDKNRHKYGDLQLVIDAIFTTPHYHVEAIKLVDNLSDHLAIVSHIIKTTDV